MKKLIYVLICIVLLTGCSKNQVKTTNKQEVPLSNIIVLEEKNNSEVNCTYQEKTETNGDYLYRAPCGGWYVFYSHNLFRGGPEDPGVMGFFISVIEADKEWHLKDLNLDWIALFGSRKEAETLVCKELRNPSGVQRSLIETNVSINCK